MTDGAFSDRLAQLKSRWDADPSSRVFLQLAEEYRHQGRVKEALGVLDRGLREHPGYLSALVAKGRCHLELGEPEPARAVLERVVKQDATQMVANKLLVRAYLDTGEPEKARERLDLYSLLTDSDPEMEELRRRLRAMEQPPQAPPPSERPSPQTAAPPRPVAGGDIFDLGLVAPLASASKSARRAERAEDDLFGLSAPAAQPVPAVARPDDPFANLWTLPAPAAVAVAPAPAAPPASAAPAEEPEPADVLFPGLSSRESRGRYLRALSSEGLFFLDLTPAAAAGEPVAAEPVAAAATVVEPELPAAEEAAVFDLEERTPWILEPEPITSEQIMSEPVSPEPAATGATATLGELYLRQGHHDEAEQIFRDVLRREPDNATAQEGLARLAPAPPEPPVELAAESPAGPRGERRALEGRDLLAGYRPAAGEPEGKARKIFLLNSYLQRLRRGGQRDVS